MLKKLTAAGIVAAAAGATMLLGGPANADRASAVPFDGCYYENGSTQPAWCRNDQQGTTYVPNTTTYPATYPATTYQVYYPGWDRDRWGRWRRWDRDRWDWWHRMHHHH